MNALTMFAQITKVDEAKRLVIGRAVQEVPDRADEIFDYVSSKPHFEAWSKSFSDDTDGKSLGNLRAMHGKVAAGKLTGIDFNDADKAIDISAKVVDEGEWNKVLEGVYTGFSIGGSYVGERKAEKIGDKEIKRYTANPSEISLVDAPCIPTAKFFEVRKADGHTEQVEFKVKATEPPKEPDEPAEKVEKSDAPLEVKGTDDQVKAFADFLNAEGLRMTDVLERLSVEAMLDTLENMDKREFSADERKKAAKEGAALPDGSFPIKTVGDLHNAISAYGRAKDKAKAKAHIIARAKALGASKELPDSWTKGSEKFTAADEELIKTSLAKPLIESDTQEAFSSNVAAEVKAGKSQEQAVAIAYAVQRKARAKGKKSADGDLHKGMWTVGEFAGALESLCNIARSAEYDAQAEADGSEVPMKLRNVIGDLIDCFKEMSDEESAELLAELKTHAGVGPDDEIEEALEEAMRVGLLRKKLNDPALSVVGLVKLAETALTDDERMALKTLDEFKQAMLGKAKMSQAHMDKIQAVHDHAADMGAECRAEEGEKSTAAELTKVTAAMETLQKQFDALAKQPQPHVVLRTLSKAEENKQARGGLPDWLTRVPLEKLVKNGDGTVDWVSSASKVTEADAR